MFRSEITRKGLALSWVVAMGTGVVDIHRRHICSIPVPTMPAQSQGEASIYMLI